MAASNWAVYFSQEDESLRDDVRLVGSKRNRECNELCEADGQHRYSVFAAADGKRAVVVVNPSFDAAITAKVALPNASNLVVATPEQPDAQLTSGTLPIPARSVVVVMEQ